MARGKILGAVLLVLRLVAGNADLACGESTLPRKLQELDQMRKGKSTSFDEVERRGRELLVEHASPEEQGQIYYQLAHIQAQSGQLHPESVIEHAERALQLPLDPLQRLQLYIYWGDALRVQDRGRKPFADTRKMAAVPYLEGLRDAQKYHIPQQKPKMPGVTLYDMPQGHPMYQQVKKAYDEQVAAQKRARMEQDLWNQRRVLTGQIVDIYTRKPHAATELRQLATKILEDPAAVDNLMKLIEEKGSLKDDPIEKSQRGPKGLPPNVQRWRPVIVAANLLAIVILSLIFWLRHRRR